MKSRKHLEPCLRSTNAYQILALSFISYDPLKINEPLKEKLRIKEY